MIVAHNHSNCRNAWVEAWTAARLRAHFAQGDFRRGTCGARRGGAGRQQREDDSRGEPDQDDAQQTGEQDYRHQASASATRYERVAVAIEVRRTQVAR